VYRVSFDGKELRRRTIQNYGVMGLEKQIDSAIIVNVSLDSKVYEDTLWFVKSVYNAETVQMF
jgi:hypothetical protein